MGLFSEYAKKGICAIPIRPGFKYPGKKTASGVWTNLEWKPYYTALPEEATLKEWDSWHDAGIGIALGAVSGIVALDFDHDVDGSHEKIQALIPDSPCKKVGLKGFTAFYRWSGEVNKKWHPTIEILSTGNQTVIPPSIHPEAGRSYTWIGKPLLSIDPQDLPTLPDNLVELIDGALGVERKEVTHTPKDYNAPTELADAEAALSHLDPDMPYTDWLNVGMSLRDEFGDAAFNLWDSWSSKGSKYPKKGEQSTRSKWNSFKACGITINTLFHMARLNGYAPELNKPPVPLITIVDGGNLKPIKERTQEGFPIELVKEAPGLVGDITKWMVDTAMYPQPVLSLAASLSTVAACMAHKVQSPTRSRSNLLVLGVAPSGSGKEHPRQCVDNVIHATGNGVLMGGKPASATGLIKSVSDGNGRRLIQIDEFGRVLKSITGRNAASHMAGLPTVIMEMFSSSTTTYYGQEYANADGARERKDISQPCLVIHASTVPEHLYEAMTGSEAVDGFLSRWLIFESKDFPLDAEDPTDWDAIPPYIMDELTRWGNAPTNAAPKGNLDAAVGVNPRVVPFTPTAEALAKDFQRAMRSKTRDHQLAGDKMHSVWARTFEHATKLALVAHTGDYIDEQVMEWAVKVAYRNSQYLCDQIELRIADNETESLTKRVLRLVKEAGSDGMKKNIFTRRTQFLERRKREDILATLIESGQVEVGHTLTGGVMYRYLRG
jgi:hypothetical protein